MRNNVWLVVVVGVLIGVGMWFAFAGNPADPAPADLRVGANSEGGRPAAVESSSLDAGGAEDSADADGAGTQPVAASNREELGWIARGRVRLGIRAPYPHGRVSGELFAGYEAKGEPIERVELKADADGEFVWKLKPPTQTVTLRVRPIAEDARLRSDTELVVIGEPPPTDLRVSVYPNDATVQGHVTDAKGRAIPGVKVVSQMRAVRVVTDAKGFYSIPVSSVSGSLSLRAGAAGFAAIRKTLDSPEPGEVVTLDLVLSPALTVRGIVVDENDRAVAGAQVATFFTSFFTSVESGFDGTFVLDYLEPGRNSHSIYARKSGYVEAKAVIQSDSLEDEYRLVLTRGVRLEGHIYGPGDVPVPGARIYLGFSPSAYNRLDAVANDDGAYVFSNVPPGEQTMVTEARGIAPDTRIIQLPEDQAVMVLDLHLQAGHFVGGHVVDEGGKPLAGVGVHGRTASVDGQDGDYIGARTRTDEKGFFRLDDLPGPTVDVEFYGSNVLRHVARHLDVDRTDHSITLKRPAGLAGTVVDAETGKPVKEFRVRFLKTEGGISATWVREGQGFKTEDGRWDSGNEDLQLGAKILVGIYGEGYGRGTLAMRATMDPDPSAAVIRLLPGGKIRGQVLSAKTGEPVSGARVVSFDDAHPLRGYEDFYGREIVNTDAAGWFDMKNLPHGEVSLSIEHDDWPKQVEGPITIDSSAQIERTVLMHRASRLTGTLLDPSGSPVGNGELQLAGDRAYASTATDAEGKFSFEVTAGEFSLLHKPSDTLPQLMASMKVVVPPGEDVDVTLKPLGTGELRGELRFPGGEVPTPFALVLGGTDGQLAFRASAINGRFHVQGLSPGLYKIFGNGQDSSGWLLAQGEATVAAGRVTDAVVELKRNQ